MDSTHSAMRDLHLDIHLGLNGGFGLSPQALSSSSTIASSDYCPFTPTSGRSTPPRCNSMDFSNSFDTFSSVSGYDFTPPGSAVSGSFSLDSSFTGSDDYDLSMYNNYPVTPTRTRANPDFQGMSFVGLQTTPSNDMPIRAFAEDMFTSTFPQGLEYEDNSDISSMWVQHDSPVNFVDWSTPQKAPLRSLSDDGKRMSLALQREQSRSPRKGPASRAKAKRSTVKRFHNGNEVTPLIGRVPGKSERVPCDWEGCNAHYNRKEHMKRHYNSIHKPHSTIEVCRWCEFKCNRGDNFKTHLQKHLKAESKSPRVKVITDPIERAGIEKTLAELGGRPRKGVKAETKRAGIKNKGMMSRP